MTCFERAFTMEGMEHRRGFRKKLMISMAFMVSMVQAP
jgi:hypothetical protein